MIKKLLALAAGAVFSMSASAGYIQYNLSGPVSGIVIQNDADRSIGFYDLWVKAPYVNAHFAPSGLFDSLTGAKYRSDAMGPTAFGAYDGATEVYYSRIWLDFWTTDTPGTFSYSATYSQSKSPEYPSDPWVTPLHPLITWLNGSVVASAGSPRFDYLDFYRQYGVYGDGLPIIVPTREVPEPVSLGLFAIGAAGLAGAASRRKSKG
jgi:hypothetical protein